jgi:hypothetical protein
MNLFVISYDLYDEKDSTKYSNLKNAIESYGDWCKCLNNVWIIKTSYTDMQVADNLEKYLGTNDKLVVIKAYPWMACSGTFPEEVKNWFQRL